MNPGLSQRLLRACIGAIGTLALRVETLLKTNPEPVEGLLGLISLQIGAWLIVPVNGPVLAPIFTNIGPPGMWGMAFLLVGTSRLFVLIHGAGLRRLRTVVAFVSCVFWIAFVNLYRGHADMFPTEPVLYSFAGASVWVLMRTRIAAQDSKL
jgi:hypothetical protein